MIQKHLLCPERLRHVPEQFSWVDHRLVRDRHIDICSHQAAALYLFLVTVADCQGLSYYADASVAKRLAMDAVTLVAARRELVRAGLICFEKPLYQVLALDVSPRCEASGPMSLGEIFARIQEKRP